MKFGRPCLIAVLALSALTGCSSVRANAIPTGPVRMPPRTGPVAVYAAGYPVGGVDLGFVEAHASQSEANVETLLPVFVRKVAQLGGNAAVIERVEARFDVSTHLHVETYTYPCGFYTCTGTRTYPVSGEVVTVMMKGRAVSVSAEHAPGSLPAPAPAPSPAPTPVPAPAPTPTPTPTAPGT